MAASGSFLDNLLNAVRQVYANGAMQTYADAINFTGGCAVSYDSVNRYITVDINVGAIAGDNTGTVSVTATNWDYAIGTGASALGRFRTVETTDATPTSIYEWPIAEGNTIVDVEIGACATGSADGACYKYKRRFLNAGGSVTAKALVTIEDDEDDPSWGGVTIDNSGTTGRVQVTGAAATTIRWTAIVQIIQSEVV